MGIISELYNILQDDFDIATEAEDITKNATAGAEKVMGSDAKKTNSDISLDTDHILTTDTGTDTNTGGDETNEKTDDKTPEEGDDSSMGNSDGEDGMGEETPESDDGESETDMENSQEDNSDEDPFKVTRKQKLWKNFNKFYTMLSDTVELVSTYVPNASDDETITMLTNVKDNLTDAKNAVYEILTRDFKSMEYEELLKQYIGLNHVHDLCTEEVKTYFEKYDPRNPKKK